MTPMLTVLEAIALFFGAAVALDVLLRIRDRGRRRGVLATGSTPILAAQYVEPRRA